LSYVRLATNADFDGIANAELSAGELFRETHMDWAVGETTDYDRLREALSANLLWVAEIDGVVAGFLMGGTCGENFHIYEAATHQDFRGQRIGSSLIEAALAYAKQNGFLAATLTTDRTLPWNAPYYLKLGFRVLKANELSEPLKAIQSSESNPQRRCAMLKLL
jgi:GNAT superfamily N-acetyltransferase